MIVLNKVDGGEILLNSKYIKSVTEDKNSVVIMSVGDKLDVKESASAITELISLREEYMKQELVEDNPYSKKVDEAPPAEPQKDVNHEF